MLVESLYSDFRQMDSREGGDPTISRLWRYLDLANYAEVLAGGEDNAEHQVAIPAHSRRNGVVG